MRSTRCRGSRASISRLPVARPRRAAAARIPSSGPRLPVHPGAPPGPVRCHIRMPSMSGVELLRKALAVDTDLAVIMLTAIDEPRTAIECLKLGAYDYLIKPVDLEELEVSLSNALRRRQLEIDRRELERWLAREVAVRTRALEERTEAIETIALDALAAARGWDGTKEAVERLAAELGVAADELLREVEKRRTR